MNQRSPLPGRSLAEIQAAVLLMLTRSWPDDIPTTVILERLGSPPSSVRRALFRLEVEGHVERRGRCWRAFRPFAPVSATPRPGRPIRPLGFREAFLRHTAWEAGR